MKRIPLALLALALTASAALAQYTDEKKTPTALLAEAARLEAEMKYDKAIEKAQKAADKAGDAKNVLARALQVMGRCNEMLSPENIQNAQAAYARIVSECGDDPVAAWARDKAAWKGVDVWLAQYHAVLAKFRDDERTINTRLSEIRAPESDPRIVELRKQMSEFKAKVAEKKTEVWGKIQPLDKDATAGLISGLGHKDEVIRAVSAEFLAEVIDEAGIAALVGKLSDDALRPGAGLALNRIFQEFAQARKYDDEATSILEDLQDIKPPSEQSQQLVEKNKDRAKALQAKAAEIRHNIPASLDTPKIQEALKSVLSEEKFPAAQIEAAKALESVGALSGPLVDALLAGLAGRNRDVRLACCLAAGAVDTSSNADKRKLADRLIEIVKYQPEVENKAESDHANDPSVRGAAATSLGLIGVIKAIPALIDALEDNASDVRDRANEALKLITGKDLGYESEPHVQDAGFSNPDPNVRKMEEDAVKRAKQIELRKKGVEAWRTWWTETEGIITLIERYWRFAGGWKAGDPTRLFDRDEFLKEIKARSYVFSDPEEALKRGERTVDRFLKRKNFLQQDALDVGPSALPKLIKYVGGELPDLEKGLMPDLVAKSRASTRMFVAETIARLAQSDTADALRDKVGGGASKDEKAGAALALGFMKEQSSAEARSALNGGLNAVEPEVREAAARALKNVGDAGSAEALTRVAVNNAQDNERAQLWALRALAAIKPKNPETVKALGELVGHEVEVGTASDKTSTSSLVREVACDALGEIGEPAAVTDLHLLRARRDLAQNVRDGAQRAIRAIGASVADRVMAILKDEKVKAADRIGAALAMGDLAETKYVTALVYRLVDENPPTVLKDQDPAVRAAVCRGLGEMKDKGRIKLVGEKLIEAMETEEQSEQIRGDAYLALKAVSGDASLPAFEAGDPAPKRATQLEEIKKWWASAKGSWREPPQ